MRLVRNVNILLMKMIDSLLDDIYQHVHLDSSTSSVVPVTTETLQETLLCTMFWFLYGVSISRECLGPKCDW